MELDMSRGFSLIEVLVSLMILAIGLLTVISLFSYSLQNVRRVTDHINAVDNAEYRFAVCRAVGVRYIRNQPEILHWNRSVSLYKIITVDNNISFVTYLARR